MRGAVVSVPKIPGASKATLQEVEFVIRIEASELSMAASGEESRVEALESRRGPEDVLPENTPTQLLNVFLRIRFVTGRWGPRVPRRKVAWRKDL